MLGKVESEPGHKNAKDEIIVRQASETLHIGGWKGALDSFSAKRSGCTTIANLV